MNTIMSYFSGVTIIHNGRKCPMVLQWNLSIMVAHGPEINGCNRGGCFKEVFSIWNFANWGLN